MHSTQGGSVLRAGLMILLLIVVPETSSGIQEAVPGVLWEYALSHNDMIGSMDNLIAGADMIYRASGRIPDPSLRFGWSPLPLETRNGPVLFSIAIMQKIPWPGVLSNTRALARSDIKAAMLNRDLAALELRSSIAGLWSEMFIIRSTMEFLEGESARLQVLYSTASARYETGQVNLSELLRLENRIILIEADQYRLELNLEAKESEMGSVLGRSWTENFRWSSSLPDVVSFLPQMNAGIEVDSFPLARRSSIELEETITAEELTRQLTRPSFEIGATWSVIGEPSIEMGAVDEGADGLMVFAGLSLPLGYSGSRYTGSAAQFSTVSAELVHSQRITDLLSMRANLASGITSLINTYHSYEHNVLPNLEIILSLTESEWIASEMTLEDVIDVMSEFRAAHLEMISIYSQIVVSASRLKELTGETTERGEFL